tara:strand:+ start:919 stop:1326 length:408 start_codon:yes stop_codon:yes gene_type:complete
MLQEEQERDFETVNLETETEPTESNLSKFVKQALSDLNLNDSSQLMQTLRSKFSGLYDSDLSVNANLKRIASNIRTRQLSGEPITDFEKIILSIADKVEGEIDKVSSEEKSELLKKYGVYALIGFAVYFLVIKKK